MLNEQDCLNLIRDLSNAPGASGFEDEVVSALRRSVSSLGRMEEDTLRNLYLYRNEHDDDKPVIQLDSHTDEVSFIVQAVKPNGTLRFLELGRWVAAGLTSQKVRVRNRFGEYIPGIITSTPPHFATEAQKHAAPDSASMTIDIGAASAEEAVNAYGIRIGEPVVADVSFHYDEAHDIMMGKAFDCRLGCAAAAATLHALKGETLAVNPVGAWACQEEVGTRGAVVTAQRVRPAAAIVFEGCPADDTVAESYMIQTAIKKGPMLRHIDARMITHPRFQRFSLDLGEKLGIPVQSAVRSGGSTNGAPIHLSGLGVPCIVIGLPVRYIHTHHGIASYADFDSAVKLACAVLRELNAHVLKEF